MPVFLVIPLQTDSGPLNTYVEAKIADAADRHKLKADRGWLITYDGTTIELSNHLEITGQEKGVSSPVGPSLVVPITGYYGRAQADMWEWLKNRIES